MAGKVEITCRYEPRSRALLVCPAQDQSKEVMSKLSDFLRMHDETLLKQDAVYEKAWINGSKVLALPGSERSVRGYSDPRFIILDEGSRIEDGTYKAALPMTAGGKSEILALSTPWGKRGWFYRAWMGEQESDEDVEWDRIMVAAPYWVDEKDDRKVVPAPPLKTMQREYAKKGVKFFYSERHTKKFCQFMLNELGPLWYRQEYQCEFINLTNSVFSEAMIERAQDEAAEILNINQNVHDDAEVLV